MTVLNHSILWIFSRSLSMRLKHILQRNKQLTQWIDLRVVRIRNLVNVFECFNVSRDIPSVYWARGIYWYLSRVFVNLHLYIYFRMVFSILTEIHIFQNTLWHRINTTLIQIKMLLKLRRELENRQHLYRQL